MKIVIIGSGIAGLALSAMLKKKGYEVVVNERADFFHPVGHGFMIHGEGLAIIESLGKPLDKRPIPGKPIDTFILKNLNNEEIKHMKMEAWQCAKRNDIVKYLYYLNEKSIVNFNRKFSHFLYDDTKAIAAVFENGDIEYGDLFVGADGANSTVREEIFGKTDYTSVEIKEILGFASIPALVAENEGVFTKFQSYEQGISFGYIPLSENDFIWFLQFDVNLIKDIFPEHRNPELLKAFAYQILEDFPPIVKEILDSTDFASSHIWNTRDFNPLPKFHSKNIVLVGDAAHLALPFTSAGTTNALQDVKQLIKSLEKEENMEAAFTSYYNSRIDIVSEHLELGRGLKYSFLNPETVSENMIPIPLIKQVAKSSSLPVQQLDILYFTDPICSTCWTIQPHLRKLKLTYGRKIRFSYIMAGLLPSWENYERGKIKTPTDVIQYWDEAAEKSGMPIDSSIWTDNPVSSSYPASIAFKAAQLQNIDKAILFLRRINEIVFMQKGDIANSEIIKKAAYDIGLDVARLLRDMEGKAKDNFYEDLNYSIEKGIRVLPSFQFVINGEIKDTLSGSVTYEDFENTILKIYPDIQKENHEISAYDIFDNYPSLTIQEFKFLTNTSDEDADGIIGKMLEDEIIKEHKTPKGIIYFANQ